MLNFPVLTTIHCNMLKIHDGVPIAEQYNGNALIDINFRYDL